MSTVALIPARGGSKSIPKKNIKLLGGKPLLHWTIEAALAADGIDLVFVSSDDQEILDCALQLGDPRVRASQRAPELATDTASTEAVMLDFARRHDFEVMLLIQATSPLTTADDLAGALRKFAETGADSLLTVTHEHRFRWALASGGFVQPENYTPLTRPRRQDWAGELVENGAFYVCRRQGLLASECRLHGRVAHWVMPSHTAVEIDEPSDWEVLEALIARHARRKARAPGQDIRLLITDVDGVLTDAGMYYGAEGEIMKKFSTRDGMGSQLWRESGRAIAIVTGENSPAVERRAEKLRIDEVHVGISEKKSVVRGMLEKRGLTASQVAYLGDDVNDLGAMQEVGFVACPADAHPRVRAVADYVCTAKGGEGCLRELVDYLQQAR